jgi:hypothetical protein
MCEVVRPEQVGHTGFQSAKQIRRKRNLAGELHGCPVRAPEWPTWILHAHRLAAECGDRVGDVRDDLVVVDGRLSMRPCFPPFALPRCASSLHWPHREFFHIQSARLAHTGEHANKRPSTPVEAQEALPVDQ